MPWPTSQARAIAISYKRRGKKPSPEVANALSTSLKGKPMPSRRRKKKRHAAKLALIRAQTVRRRR